MHVKYEPWRANQVRGISPLASSIATSMDLETVVKAECAVSKKSSQLLAQICDTADSADAQPPSTFTPEELEGMTDEEIEAAAAEEEDQTVAFDEVRSVGANVIQLPRNKRLELLDPKHPNLDAVQFIRQLQARVTNPLGIAAMYSTFEDDGSSKSAREMSWQTFYGLQKQLERLCDYVFYKFAVHLGRKGVIDLGALPEDWLFNVKWSWPTMESLDEVQNQTAIKAKLENLTGSYSEILGPDWREKLEQTAAEIDWLRKRKLPVPQYNLISGGEKYGVDGLDQADDEKLGESGEPTA